MGRTLVWFSCGAASASAAKLALESLDNVEILYCDTLAYEHPDNKRFMEDCEKWFGTEIKILKSEKYTDIFDVFDKTGYLVGQGGARCTLELKKRVRQAYERRDDQHIFGMTAEETKRIERFELHNPELKCIWNLRDAGMGKQDCINLVSRNNIELPMMYKLGYKNNNCIGCVKGGKGYWNKIRVDFPDAFEKMARQERKMNWRVIKDVFLDELPARVGRYESELDIECGVTCDLPREISIPKFTVIQPQLFN